ncbi:MAG: CotH kinase family protein [Oscillospiraceae bacterium]|nr:CotH kinase family protein [Oscillospiraceae bacterium]
MSRNNFRNHFRSHILPLLFSCTLLTGCAAGGTQSVQDSVPTESLSSAAPDDSSAAAPEPQKPDAAPTVLPVLSIRTQKQGADALDFFTEPVARHVAKQIASWTPGYVIPPEPYYEQCAVSLTDTAQQVLLDAADAEVKVRGNWTTTYDKKSLRIKFAEKQNLLGLNDGAEMKNWLLLAEFKDVSMQRSKTALQIARELLEPDGLYAADAAFVELHLNGDYYGVYLLTEYQQVNPNRVNISDPKKDETGTGIGYFLEFDGYFYSEDPLHQFHVDYADNAPLTPFDGAGGNGKTITCLPESPGDPKIDIGFSIKSDIYSQEQHDFIANYVNQVYRIMYAAAYEHKAYRFDDDFKEITEAKDMTPQEAVEAVVDTQSLADAYLVAELTCDADIYWSSFFMDADFGEGGGKKLTFEAPWDFDSGLGNKARCADGSGFYAANIVPEVNGVAYETVNPWLAVLMNEDWFQQIVREKWTAAYDDGVFERALDTLKSDAAAYHDAFVQNDKRWGVAVSDPGIAKELSPASQKCRTQEAASELVTKWLEARVSFLNDYWHV